LRRQEQPATMTTEPKTPTTTGIPDDLDGNGIPDDLDAAFQEALDSVERRGLASKDQDVFEIEEDDGAPDNDDGSVASVESDDPPAPATSDALRIVQLEAELAEFRDKWMRTAAELDNFRRRAARERDELRAKTREDLLKDMLPLVDHLLQAEATLKQSGTLDDNNPVLEGVRLVARSALDTFKRAGVEPIESVGKAFDPALHEAVSTMPSNEHAANTVAAEVRKGFKLNGQLIRPAMVVVSSGAAN
jgi:molecular chaperone GrpE